jgi:hypothetical protein
VTTVLLVVVVVGSVAATVYVLGVVVTAWLVVCRLPGWLRERPGAFGGPRRRIATIPALVLGWPCCLLGLGIALWRERHRCPAGGCGAWGWPPCGRAQRATSPVSGYRCAHETARPGTESGAHGPAQARDTSSWRIVYDSLCAGLAATALGALASAPIPGQGFLFVWCAVTFSTLGPLHVLIEELLGHIEQRLSAT